MSSDPKDPTRPNDVGPYTHIYTGLACLCFMALGVVNLLSSHTSDRIIDPDLRSVSYQINGSGLIAASVVCVFCFNIFFAITYNARKLEKIEDMLLELKDKIEETES